MKTHAFRLENGQELKEEIINYCIQNNINFACVISSVGSLNYIKMRLAGAKDFLEVDDDLEIISLNGTIANAKAHLHISVSDDKADVYGGHFVQGIINTTAEVILLEIDNYEADRLFDENTGFRELVINRGANEYCNKCCRK